MVEVGDFRRGSISVNYRRCGKANCACASPEHPGHGPRLVWTRSGPGGKTVGRQVAPGEADKLRRELDAYQAFAALSDELLALNEVICEARPVSPLADSPGGHNEEEQAGSAGQKGGSATGSPKRSRPNSRASPR
ncbi:MAG: DUF6788 family protein [Acidimicrobiales bacterium]